MTTGNLVCQYCGLKFTRSIKAYHSAIKRNNTKFFCSRECSRKFVKASTPMVKAMCSWCGNVVLRPYREVRRNQKEEIFCNKSCAASYKNTKNCGIRHPNYKHGKGVAYREKALDYYGEKCSICGYNIRAVLEVHHKDCNRKNSKMSNLDVLCPTHHNEFHFGIRKYGECSRPIQAEVCDTLEVGLTPAIHPNIIQPLNMFSPKNINKVIQCL